jgi:hypothetical protein
MSEQNVRGSDRTDQLRYSDGASHMDETQARRDWIARVLGIQTLASSGSASEPRGESELRLWQNAKDAADAQLNKLYDVLRSSGLPILGEAASDIESTLEGFRVGLVGPLLALERATGPAREQARVAAAKSVASARARLASDPRVIAADTNPFGVSVSVGSILGRALEQLETRLGSAGATP